MEQTLHTAAEVAASPGMPQLDPSSFASQLFWLTVTFVFLYIVLARSVLPRIHDVLEQRQFRITHDLDRAEQLQKEADEAKAAYEKALADARGDAQELLNSVQQSIKSTSEDKQKELNAILATKIAESEKEIQTARNDALDSLTPASSELAGIIVEKLVSTKPSNEKLGAAIKELSKEKPL